MKCKKFLIPFIMILSVLFMTSAVYAAELDYEYEPDDFGYEFAPDDFAYEFPPDEEFTEEVAPPPDLNRKCDLSVSMALESSDADFSGSEVTLYKVADVFYTDALEYHYINGFENFQFRMRIVDMEQTAINMFNYAVANDIEGETLVADENGRAVYKNLDPGLYLLVMTKIAHELYSFEPFFISMPYWIDNEWRYDAASLPKVDIASSKERRINISVKKIWNDDNSARPDYIEAELINDYGSYSVVKLSDENNWSHTWKNLTNEENWSVVECNVPDGYTVEYQQNGNDFIIQNTKNLIYTGQINKPIPFLLCGGLLLIVIGLSLSNSEGIKNEKN